MFPYKTNSPDYLDYVASCMTREEILADSKLCFLLENEYIKDNMEVALKWKAAKFGGYEEKYDFVEYYLCNGPELDADTILHYRGRAQADPVVMEIAYSYFSNPETLSDIREKKYGKKRNNDWTDCFTNPCFYLGDFSPAMGSMGDSGNYASYWKNIASKWSLTLGEKKQKMKQNQAKAIGANSPSKSAKTVIEDAIKPKSDTDDDTGTQPTAIHTNQLRPSYRQGWEELGQALLERDREKYDRDVAILDDNHTGWLQYIKMDDWFGGALAQTLDQIDKVNTVRQLGDCYRLWSQVRRLQIFGKDNQYSPITSDQLVGDRMPDGTNRTIMGNTHPTPKDSTDGIAKTSS